MWLLDFQKIIKYYIRRTNVNVKKNWVTFKMPIDTQYVIVVSFLLSINEPTNTSIGLIS
jgi:hypothetical protein